MLSELLEQAELANTTLDTAILYRGAVGAEAAPASLSLEEALKLERDHAAARSLFGLEDGLLELIEDPSAYLESVRDIVTGPAAVTKEISKKPLEELPYHLTYKCDGCLYNEFCMKDSAERDDLSLLPHLTGLDKEALRRNGVKTNRALSRLKVLQKPANTLTTSPGQEGLVRRLSATWPVGPRVDELIHRALLYRRWKKDPVEALSYIPSKGHGSLPFCSPEHNPNLVKIYLDVQHDYLQDRIYLLSALVVGYENGLPVSERRRSVVKLAETPPDSLEKEESLFLDWLRETLLALVEIAAPDATGEPNAPIHLIFYDRQGQRALLDGLSRHLPKLFSATPVYDFLTQLAAFDSPVASYLEEEIRELKNYPMVCQSLQQVAAYRRFDWNQPEPFRQIFKERMFDFWGKLDRPTGDSGNLLAADDGASDPVEAAKTQESPWFNNRARFSSQIPLEYAYQTWGELPLPAAGPLKDPFEAYRQATQARLIAFQERRLEALEHIANEFRGNHLTEKRPFKLPDLANFKEKATHLAQALEEFTTIEHHVQLAEWKATHNLAPERRVLMGETLLVSYQEEDQFAGVAGQNRENERRRLLEEQYRAAYKATHPNAASVRLSKDQKEESHWDQSGLVFRLRLDITGLDCSLEDALLLSNLREDANVILYPRFVVDSRLPVDQQTLNTPTPRQMLYGTRARLRKIERCPDERGQTAGALLDLEIQESRGGNWSKGYVFPASHDKPLSPGQLYTLDEDPNTFYGYWLAVITEELVKLENGAISGANTLYRRLSRQGQAVQPLSWPETAHQGQALFLEGLQAFYRAGAFHALETSKQAYIGGHGADPVLLVQGPPGTGKSYSTGFALLARMQGAIRAGLAYRALVTCKTHAATDVLIANVLEAQNQLRRLFSTDPALFQQYFNRELLEIPLYRVSPKEAPPEGIRLLVKDAEKEKGAPSNYHILQAVPWLIAAATPGSIYSLVKEAAGKPDNMFNFQFYDCLVLDEASQMNLPEACMAALGLKENGQLIVVGDHRQMPPIVKHDWDSEPRRTFKQYKSYQSLFNALLDFGPGLPMIKFSESFRLHAAMAEFLRQEIYCRDNIAYFSARDQLLKLPAASDPLLLDGLDSFVSSVLNPQYPIVVVMHDEAASQTRNAFEQHLIGPVVEALVNPDLYGLDAQHGLGVVVPHRVQRAEIQKSYPALTVRDADSGEILFSAVDTVERFQGGERKVIMVSATESEPDYLLASGEFLYDPRRLTVAISRAKEKVILVASRSVFALFSPDEETFNNAQLWKNLLHRTCTDLLWEGEREGEKVSVWGNQTFHPLP
jgi:hypothetical protein